VLFRLHRATWAETAFPSFAGREPFHRAFARLALERGWLRLHILELAQKPVAAYYGFRIGQVEWGYQFGRDRAEDRASVGAVIAGHAIRESIAEGAGQFRLGPGAQAYKTRLATDDPGVETIGLADGLRGHAVLRASARRAAAA